MKKYISLVLVATIIASFFAIGTVSTSAASTTMPDWVITEICPDNYAGDNPHSSGYSDNKDPFEFIEIVNTSGRVLDIYDYCMTYNGYTRGNADGKFENLIVEITPIKAGNFLDGSTPGWSDGTYSGVGLENIPQNPESGLVNPGEVVVLWSYYNESGYTMFNDGKGMQFEDFRSWHNIPENVKVFAYDSNSGTSRGGHDKNFNVKNSEVGTYGIALYTDELNNLCNVKGGEMLAVPYTSYDGFACWATLDFSKQIVAGHTDASNITYEFTYDFGAYAPKDLSLESVGQTNQVADTRRMILLTFQNWTPSAGTLNPLQKMTLGIPLEAGEKFATVSMDYIVYTPIIDGAEFEGYLINDVLYKLADPYALEGPEFVAETAGAYTFDYKYTNDGKTYSKVVELTKTEETTAAEETTEAPKDETTAAPEDETTAAPTVADTTKAPETTKASEASGGCGAVVGGIAIVALIGTAVVLKKRD